MKFIWPYVLLAVCAAAHGETPSGRWDLTATIDKTKIPFSMELEFNGGTVSGTFTNGPDKVSSTRGTLSGETLRLTFQPDDKLFEAKITRGNLNGTIGGYTVEGAPYCTCASEGEAGPDISGSWTLSAPDAATSSLVIQRKGEDTIANLFRPDDKNGALTGRFDGLAFMLHHFDGVRASLLEIEPQPDGSLDVTIREPRAAAKKFRAVKRP
jgi:hypothetical protein